MGHNPRPMSNAPITPWLQRPRRPAVPALLVAALLLVTMLLLLPPAARGGAQTAVIASALSAEGDGDEFPVGAPTRMVALPDDWAATRPGSHGPVWYRVAFLAAEPRGRTGNDLLAVYIERACTNLEVFVNGQLVHSGGRMSGRVTNNCNHPQLVSLPSALIQQGLNTLDIKLVGVPATQVASRQRAGGLSELEVGLYQTLAPRHAWQTSLQVGSAQGVSATMLLMGGFMFVMGWVNRRESHLAYFGALSVGWALIESRLWLRELPFAGEVVDFLLAAVMPFLTLTAVQFLLRYGGMRDRRISAVLAAQCAVMPLMLMFGGPDRLNVLARFWYTLFALQVLAAGAWYLRTQWRANRRSFWVMSVLLGMVMLAVLVEFFGLREPLPALAAVAAQTVPPVILIIVGLRLMQQHGQALQKSEADRATLEARVAEARAEIENNFKQLAQLRVEQVTERERKRIAADLHDDLGAKLLTIVHTSESERISTLAREALEEMRLSVRGLTGKPVLLDDAIADWRAEVVSRLGQAGIESEWTTPMEELPQTLSARAYVQTTRIIREAVSNAIKHSGATLCTVTCAVAEGDFQLVIQDNGGGIPMELDGRLDRGHGMASMKARAKQLQGQCLVESGPGYGTVIRLTVPLERAVEPA
jgi:signal transduction histidine kinase